MATYTASIKNHPIASTTNPQHIEGNVYFPPSSIISPSSLKPSSAPQTTCPWKGLATYYDIEVDGKVEKGAAWTYLEPKTERAAGLKGWVAFYKSKVEVKSE